MKIVTSSSLSAFRECPRKYFLRYEVGRVPTSDKPTLAFGKIMHGALEAWWLNGYDAAIDYLQDNGDDERINPETNAKALALLQFYNPPKHEYEVIDVEVPFQTKIYNGVRGRAFYGIRLAGKVDVLVKHKKTGETWIVDHKTTVSEVIGFGTYWQALQVDAQMAAYCIAYKARGFVYDVLRKPQIRLCAKDHKAAEDAGCAVSVAYMERCAEQIKAEPTAWYQWRPYTKTDDDIMEAQQDLWQWVEMFHACNKVGRWPRCSGACVSRYGTCEYIDVCTGRASLDDDDKFRTKEETHEELTV